MSGPECEFSSSREWVRTRTRLGHRYELDRWKVYGTPAELWSRTRPTRPRYKEGYSRLAAADKLPDIRSRSLLKLIEKAFESKCIKLRWAPHRPGPMIDMSLEPLVNNGPDKVKNVQYVVKKVCARRVVASSCPKHFFMDKGSG